MLLALGINLNSSLREINLSDNRISISDSSCIKD